MTWGEACAALLEGKKVRRAVWKPFMWLFVGSYRGAKEATLIQRYDAGHPYMIEHTVQASDMAATDWEIIENEN